MRLCTSVHDETRLLLHFSFSYFSPRQLQLQVHLVPLGVNPLNDHLGCSLAANLGRHQNITTYLEISWSHRNEALAVFQLKSIVRVRSLVRLT